MITNKISNKNCIYLKIILIIIITAIIFIGFIFVKQKKYYSAEQSKNTAQSITVNGWQFPNEEGEHQNLQTEWWYFASHLENKNKPEDKFGFTIAFFKNSARIMMNLTNGVLQENFSSIIKIDYYDIFPKENLAVKKGENFWLEEDLFKYKIHFELDDKEIDLNLNSIKNPFIRYITPNTFYYQQTRVETSGFISFSGEKYEVKGLGWIDHQGFKDFAVPPIWRWYAIQLDNNTEMAFTIYLYPESNINKFQKTSLFLFEDDQMEEVENNDYSIEVIDYWTNSDTGYRYPIKSRLKIPQKNANLEITAIIKDQTIKGSDKAYSSIYLGSCRVEGIFEGQLVFGTAQLDIVSPEKATN